MAFLGMSHDDARGVISLKDGIFDITWNKVGCESNFFQVNRRMSKMTKGMGGTFIPYPKWAIPQKRSVFTGHPLGGCSMGESGKSAVVNHAGQVFDGRCRISDLTKLTLFFYICHTLCLILDVRMRRALKINSAHVNLINFAKDK